MELIKINLEVEMRETNLNKMAERVAAIEGKKISLDIAQIKEVMKIVFEELAALPSTEVEEILKEYR